MGLYIIYNQLERINNMPLELKILLVFGLCYSIYEGINLYIKWRVIKIINDNEKSNHNQ